MQATLNRCLVVALFPVAVLFPKTTDLSHEKAIHEWHTVQIEKAKATFEAIATKTRLTNYIKAHWKASPELAKTIVATAHQQSQLSGMPVTLILAIIAKESSFKPDAVSAYGAQGLMQVVPRWHPEKLASRPADALLRPVDNIEVGVEVLGEYWRKANGNAQRALKKYSGGANAYHERVMRYKNQFELVSVDDRYLVMPDTRKSKKKKSQIRDA